MEIIHHIEDSTATVKLIGSLTFEENQKFRELLSTLAAEDVSSVKVDFSDTDFIDSAGLGMMLLMRDSMERKGAPVVLCNATGQIEKMFTLSKFNTLFTVE